MKLLRVLTGFHAGAQLNLAPGAHRIGATADADIQLGDWQGADALLQVEADGGVHIVSSPCTAPESGGEGELSSSPPPIDSTILADLVPVRFGELVLCVGPVDASWPSDIELLMGVLKQPPQPRPRISQYSRQLLSIVAACVLLGTVAVTGLLMNTTEPSHASTTDVAGTKVQQISNSLVAAHLMGLRVRAAGKTIVVSGLVLNDADDRVARRILAQFPTGIPIERTYGIAQQVTRSIGDMLHVDGAYVTYLGDGRFAVNGPAAERNALETQIALARDDLGANVAAIELHTRGSGASVVAGPTTKVSELLASERVRFAETPDGVKHLFSAPSQVGAEVQSSQPGGNNPDKTDIAPIASPYSPAADLAR